MDYWVKLSNVETGEIRLNLAWLPVSLDQADYKASEGKSYSR